MQDLLKLFDTIVAFGDNGNWKMIFMWIIGGVLILRTATVEQRQIWGTATIMSAPTLPNSSTAAGVIVMVLDGSISPSTAIARLIASTVPPVGTAMLAWNATS